jgi:peptidoglycan/LPS O-acetylase OafA/YrhL
MERFRPHVIILVVIAVVVLAILFSHGIRIRLEWGGSGFLAGLLCGVLVTIEVHHRRNRRQEHHDT